MDESRRPAGCAALGLVLVLPLFGLQAVGFAGVVLSANGLDRFVPGVQDVDGDGSREVVIGCPIDACVTCDWKDLGPLHVATLSDAYGCGPYH